MPRPNHPQSPFRCSNSSPEVIRLVVMESLVTTRDKAAALKFMKKAMKR